MMMTGGDYIQASKEHNIGSFRCSKPPENPEKNNNMENKRRFTDEQIRSLECIFESESKLEPRKKMQLARDLGLQPRQVAIWFQNRRARWKSKHIEQEYRKLRDEYDNLSSLFESTKKEKESLQAEVQKLRVLVETCGDSSKREKGLGWKIAQTRVLQAADKTVALKQSQNSQMKVQGIPRMMI